MDKKMRAEVRIYEDDDLIHEVVTPIDEYDLFVDNSKRERTWKITIRRKGKK